MTSLRQRAMPKAEMSRPLPLGKVERSGFQTEFSASDSECVALARRFDLIAIKALHAHTNARRLRNAAVRGTVHIDGRVQARVVQTCVVSMAPVVSDIDETFNLYYAPADAVQAMMSKDSDPLDIDPLDDAADPEPVFGDVIDLGEAVAQQLSLALNPYPRAAGLAPGMESVVPPESGAGNGSETNPDADTHRPFAGLEGLLQSKRDDGAKKQ